MSEVFGAIANAIRQHAASGKRSSALVPLQWLIGLVGLIFIAATASGNVYAMGLAGVLLVIGFVFFLFQYQALRTTNIDALRSEEFVLRKTEIELYGDDVRQVDARPTPLRVAKDDIVLLESDTDPGVHRG